MGNSFFNFKQFEVHQDRTAMKVCTDASLFGAWVAASALAGEAAMPKSILDIGSGTGLLSLMLAQKISAPITAIEIEEDAFGQTKENFARSPWHNRLYAHHISFLQFAGTQLFDLIITNPPFYENSLSSPTKAKNVAHHSSRLTLGEVFFGSSRLLTGSGCLYMLLPFSRSDESVTLAEEFGLHLIARCTVKQTEKHAPFRVMQAFSFHKTTCHESELTIKKGDNYSTRFVELLKDYYLKL